MKAFIALALASAAVVSNAAIYDLTADFNSVSNPNGPWSYGYRDSSVSPRINFDSNFNTGTYRGWFQSSLGTNPQISQNQSGSLQNGVPNGSVFMHPGPNGQFASLLFTLPEAGIVSVDGSIGAGDNGDIDFLLLVDGILVDSATDLTTTRDFSATSPMSMPVGTQVELLIGFSGSFLFDSTPVSATVQVGQPVPEPATLAGVALGGLALLRRRNRKS